MKDVERCQEVQQGQRENNKICIEWGGGGVVFSGDIPEWGRITLRSRSTTCEVTSGYSFGSRVRIPRIQDVPARGLATEDPSALRP